MMNIKMVEMDFCHNCLQKTILSLKPGIVSDRYGWTFGAFGWIEF